MKDFTVIQWLVWWSFLAGLSSYYAYGVWENRRRMAVAFGQRFLLQGPEIQRWGTLFRLALHSGKTDHTLNAGAQRHSAVSGKSSRKDRLSVTGDWLAPVIVWFLIITMGLAVVAFLLGER